MSAGTDPFLLWLVLPLTVYSHAVVSNTTIDEILEKLVPSTEYKDDHGSVLFFRSVVLLTVVAWMSSWSFGLENWAQPNVNYVIGNLAGIVSREAIFDCFVTNSCLILLTVFLFNHKFSTQMPKSKVLKTASEVTNDRWVLIVPEQGASQVENDDHFVTLPHPKTGHSLQYLLKGNGTELFEVVKFSEQPRSWFIDNHVVQDGSLYVVTRFDPLFMVLPFLKNSSSKFMTLDHILQDSEHQFIGKISKCIPTDDVRLLCDVKGEEDLVVCKLNDEKVIAWLKTKVEQTKDRLQNLNISASGSQASTFIRSSKNARDCTQGDYLLYALGLLSDYISDYWSQKVRVALGIVNELMESSGEEPASKKVKLENGVVGKPNEDYSNYFAKNKKSAQNSNVKLSSAHKSLMKVNKKGMKNISSFFGTTSKTSGKSK